MLAVAEQLLVTIGVSTGTNDAEAEATKPTPQGNVGEAEITAAKDDDPEKQSDILPEKVEDHDHGNEGKNAISENQESTFHTVPAESRRLCGRPPGERSVF